MIIAVSPLRSKISATKARRRVIATGLTGLAALTVAGCSFSCSVGGENSVSSTELAAQVERSYEAQTDVQLNTLVCDSVAAEVDETFTCEGNNASEVELEIEGTLTAVDEATESIDFDWSVVQASAPGTHYASAAKRTLEQQVGAPLAGMSCPERVELEVDSEVRCTLETTDGDMIGVTLTLTDLDGGFDLAVDETDEPATGV